MCKLFKYVFCILAVSLFASSCIDKDYDIDDLNKNAVLPIPPVPIGNIDTIWVKGLPDAPVFLPEIPVAGRELAKKQVIKDLFTKDILDKLFFEGATTDVTLESLADIRILQENSGLEIDVHVEVADSEGEVITKVVIPSQKLVYGDNQSLNIVFPVQYFEYMHTARDLNLVFVLRANTINLTDSHYAYIKDIVLKSGGIHVKF